MTTTHDPKTTELNTYKKYLTRRCLDSIRTEYNTSLTTGAKSLDFVKSAVDIAVSVPTGVYDIIANFLAWIPRKGDNCDILDITNVKYARYGMMVYDKQETWRAAQVLEVTYPFTDTPAFLIHYKSWGSRYDDIISAVGLDRIQPAFSKTPNWRPKVKRGDNLEFLIPNRFDERYWRVGVVLKNEFGKLDLMTVENLESLYTKRRIEHFKYKHNSTLDEYYTGYSNSRTLMYNHKVYLYKNIDIHSEMLAFQGTHLTRNFPKRDQYKELYNKISRQLGYRKII